MAEDDEHEHDLPPAAALPPEQEDRIVDRVVSKIKEVVLAPGAALDELDDDDDDDPPAKEPTSVKEIETDMESQVRQQLKKIKAEDEHAAEHEKLKAEPEREPVMVGRVTRALWGNGS